MDKKYGFNVSKLDQYSLEKASEYCAGGIDPDLLIIVSDTLLRLQNLGVLCVSIGEICISKVETTIRIILVRSQYSNTEEVVTHMYKLKDDGIIDPKKDHAKYEFKKQLDKLAMDFYNPSVFFLKFIKFGDDEGLEENEIMNF